MEAHTFNSSTQAEAAGSLIFEANLLYRVSSRTAIATQRDPILKKQNKTKTKNTKKKKKLKTKPNKNNKKGSVSNQMHDSISV